MAKQPSLQFYFGDWKKDPAVSTCSYAARGLWLEMLGLMFDSVERGYLLTDAGKPMTPAQLCRATGGDDVKQVEKLLAEMQDSGVYSTDENGRIYNRRMVREASLSRVRMDAAKRRWDGRFAPDSGEVCMDSTDAKLMQNIRPSTSASAALQPSTSASAALAAFPQFAAAARESFPTCDDVLLAELVEIAKSEYPPITDAEMEAVLRGATKRNQRSAALWRQTIPEVIRSWKKRS